MRFIWSKHLLQKKKSPKNCNTLIRQCWDSKDRIQWMLIPCFFPTFAHSTAKAHSRPQQCTQCAPPKINAFNSTHCWNFTCKFSHIFRIQSIYFEETSFVFWDPHCMLSAQQNLFPQLQAPLLCPHPEANKCAVRGSMWKHEWRILGIVLGNTLSINQLPLPLWMKQCCGLENNPLFEEQASWTNIKDLWQCITNVSLIIKSFMNHFKAGRLSKWHVSIYSVYNRAQSYNRCWGVALQKLIW